MSEEAATAAWNRRADGWVSVEERLPDIRKHVLCLEENGHQFVGTNDREGGEYWQSVHSRWATRSVTHWRPLPEAPESTDA